MISTTKSTNSHENSDTSNTSKSSFSDSSAIVVGDFIGNRPPHLRKLSADQATEVTSYCTTRFDKFKGSTEYKHFQEFSALGASAATDILDSDSAATPTICHLQHSQIEVGDLLGQGGFSGVYGIRKCLSSDIDDDDCDKYVVKMLQNTTLQNPPTLAVCALGLAKEGALLSMINHPHILKVKGMSTSGLASLISGRNDCQFLVLERLHETLTRQLVIWCRSPRHVSKFSIFPRRRRHQKRALSERLNAAAHLADAVSYLHKHNILHRDLKPDNVGFDADGSLKLFDFDVARFTPATTNVDETFQLTQRIGTRRYMSPECGLGKPYNLKADVYSFAILLWEMVTMKEPFDGFCKEAHIRFIFKNNERPEIARFWPIGLQSLLASAWSADISKRPTMAQVHIALQEEAQLLATSKRKTSECNNTVAYY